ncbi:MAG: ABC transporter ATP-binding protein/permease [Treponema sp.]|jgi:ABC-type multidrug transport system fused ATPase/permease subunit|nr:ABC transporter ATP-binding protein/permease [Treponema sp.]
MSTGKIKSRKPRSPLARIFLDSRAQWPGLSVLALSSGLSALFKLLGALFWGNTVDAAVSGQFQAMGLAAAMTLLFVFLDAVKMPVHFFILGKTTEKMFLNIRMRAFTALTRGDTAALEKTQRSGDTALRINSDAEQLCNSISENFSHIARYIVQLTIGISGCIALSWQLAAAYLLILPLSIWLVKAMGDPIQNQRKLLSQATGKAMNLAVGALTGIATVKSFGLQEDINRKFALSTEAAYKQAVMTEKVNSRMNLVKQFSSLLQIMVLFVFGTFLVYRDLLSVGRMLSFIAVGALIAEVLGDIDRMISSYNQALAMSQRLYDVFDIPPELEGSSESLDFDGDIAVLEDVAFSYTEGEPLLEGINLKLGRNQRIGIIGPSGCGKSTLVKLICGFYRPVRGKLTLFGQPAETLKLETLRKEIALVAQDAVIFDTSIYENVLYGRPGAEEKEVAQAIDNARLSAEIAAMPEGIYTQAGEFGGRLSGGQRQRIAIARAMLKNARLVFLDEASSALDAVTEAEVQKAMEPLLEGRAAVVVAHRLAVTKNLDYIYCMDKGRIVEEGSPADLLAAKAYYYEMCRQQGLLPLMEGLSDASS